MLIYPDNGVPIEFVTGKLIISNKGKFPVPFPLQKFQGVPGPVQLPIMVE
jgi:hypothetical protein